MGLVTNAEVLKLPYLIKSPFVFTVDLVQLNLLPFVVNFNFALASERIVIRTGGLDQDPALMFREINFIAALKMGDE